MTTTTTKTCVKCGAEGAVYDLRAAPGVYQLEPAQTDGPTEPMTVWEGNDRAPVDPGRRLWAIVKGPHEAEQRRKLLAADRRRMASARQQVAAYYARRRERTRAAAEQRAADNLRRLERERPDLRYVERPSP